DDVVEEAVAFAQQMCDATAPFGLRLTKECLQASLDGTSFESVIKMENRNQVLASNTTDGQMGVGKMNPKNKQDVKDNPEKYKFHNL
ncbi:MAG: enoyl-CoA hydratase/isomerase family protein, partial [Gordonibacter sp.]